MNAKSRDPRPQHPAGLMVGTIVAAAALLLSLVPASAQFRVEDGYRNLFSRQGAPVAPITDPLIPGNNDPLFPAYQLQWRSGTALGGFQTTRILSGATVVAGLASTTPGATGTLILPTGGGVKLASVTMGRPISVVAASFGLGSIIPTPVGPNGDPDYYLPEPANQVVGGVRNDKYYWSPHARKVYATQPGVIEIEWKARSGGANLIVTYAISSAPAKPERKIFWTEKGFSGPKVEVPASRVSAVNFVYNTLVPATVPVAFVSPYETPPDPTIQQPAEKRTVWYEPLDQQIHAYNREGRVFLEYLGNLNPDGLTREQLGYEIVNIDKETRPVTLKVDIGETVGPPPDTALPGGGLGPDPDLTYSIVAGAGLTTDPYVYEHLSLGGSKKTLYAIRQTAPGTFVDGVLQQSSNEVLIYWKEAGERGIYWPKYYAGYILDWPASDEAYSLYARQHQSQGDSPDTGVLLDSANNPALVYQDDPGKQQAVLAPGNLFYSLVTGADGRALIRYTNGDDIWFERVLSRVDTNFTSYGTAIPTDVGTRITPPTGSDSLIGYIRQPTGTAFDVGAYIDPFVSGFEEAAKGAIIGVNALPGKDKLEIWWYKKSNPPGSKLKPTYWPSYVTVHTLRWPAAPPQIVMASNAGTNALPSVQATGKIYYQNDPAKPGYNPNEEHALMLNGRAWALRDDLNVATSSQPYVLLSYTAPDGRPDMRVFKLLRENSIWKFSYPAIAGKVVQSPMPLPILPAPLKTDGSLSSYEFQQTAADIPAGFDMARDAEYLRYRRFTWTDRKGTVWMMRGPHAGNPSNPATAPNLRMRYFYKTLDGFNYPSESSQPTVGTLTPYLRPFANGSNSSGGFTGNAVTGAVQGEVRPRPQDIVFTPTWPAAAPELRVGETLTAAKLGLPAVRGQTSARILYEQSVATDPDSSKPLAERLRSARLFDPTRAKTFTLGTDGGLAVLPASIKTSSYLGKTYFPNLPPHLSQRFYLDPAAGGPKGQLALIGVFKDEPVGEKYLQLNILSAADVAALKGLCDSNDLEFANWQAAVDGLSTTVETFKEDPAKRGTYIVDTTGAGISDPDEKGLTYPRTGADTLPDRRPLTYGPGELAEINFSDSAVDSYALSASGGGEGFVVLAVGDGAAFTPKGEPVSLHVIKVTPPLYRGELKVIASANPLDEKLTFQHSGDFAGHPEEYDFEWRYAPPVDGIPPELYTVDRTLILGDSNGSAATEWRYFKEPGEDFAALRSADADADAGVVTSLPGQIEIPPNPGSSVPSAVLRRTFTYTGDPMRLFLSIDLAAHSGATVYLNQALVAVRNVPGQSNTPEDSSPGGSFTPLPHVYEISPSALVTGKNVITIEMVSDADPGSMLFANARLEGTVETEHINSWLGISPGPFDTPPGETSGSVTGKVRHVIEGSSLLTLTDNYFIVRYRAKSDNNAAWQAVAGGGGWSKWTNPQLGEGWIKRVLAGINPFQQRVTDLFNNPVNTDSSMLSQAGKRWEGDIALNLENINSFGLIEIYETVLRRGKMLSIDGTPPLNYDGANDALLLAAGYLNDLYMLVGNEAFADAANPTIAYSDVLAGGNAGSVATSLFAFKGQQASVLDEELSLLRGRDDLLQPGTRTAPAYNRLFWNYTRGIDSGEAIYALNYNIRDVDLDGTVSATDATRLYPQGHGDAYGHYLTALTNYYGLLNNPNFAWVPRTEAVLVLGQPVQVDYTDERKFAAAAAALSRTANQITDLSYRQQYSASANAGWSQLKDTTSNPRSGMARHWGTDEWASRGGQGAYFHWVTANSLLPAVDDDPNHQGIRKIDRTTVPELSEIAAQAASIQQTLDNADARLNPLGLTPGAMQFDLDPTFLDVGSTAQTGTAAIQGQTHYDQIYQRALAALKNAATAFANAEDSTRFLRSQEDSLAEQRAVIAEQEQAYTNQLIEIYGTPYTDDIGPGRTYSQGYAGPDLVHPMYVEITEYLAGGGFTPIEESYYNIYTTLDPSVLYQIASAGIDLLDPTAEIPGATVPVVYTLGAISGQYRKPDTWTGRRTSPGRMQTAISNELLARQNVFGAVYDFDRLKVVIQRRIQLFQSALNAHDEALKAMNVNAGTQTGMRALELALNTLVDASDRAAEVVALASEAVAEAPPTVGGPLAIDATSPVRSAAKASGTTAYAALMVVSGISGTVLKASELARESMDQFLDIDIAQINWKHENNQMLSDLRQSLQDYINSSGTVDATMRQYDQAQRDLFAVQAEGDRLQKQRLVFRQRAAALVQGYRTRDFAFRAFRNEALDKYKTLFDLASKYTYLTASSYDYETGLLNAEGNSSARTFLEQIVKARAVGTVIDNVPQIGGSSTGDPGLAGVLARMNGDWSVVKTRFGLNNPDPSLTTFSLRAENFRIANGAAGDLAWRDILGAAKKRNINDDPDVRRYCLQAADPNGQEVPGFILEFSTSIGEGFNFFGKPLAGGDHTFTPTAFATKVRSSGIALKGYVGMDSPGATGEAVDDAGGVSPGDPSTAFTDSKSLSATPYVYLIPAGTDFMRSPPLGDSSFIRSWQISDQAIPLPFNIGGTSYANDPFFVSGNSLSEPLSVIRKHQAFRAVPDGTDFPSSRTYTNSRLIGRSAWNSRWKIVIPGRTLLANPEQGLQTFLETVKDIKLHLETYSYSGN